MLREEALALQEAGRLRLGMLEGGRRAQLRNDKVGFIGEDDAPPALAAYLRTIDRFLLALATAEENGASAAAAGSNRRDCHSAAPPSPFSKLVPIGVERRC